MGSVASPTQPTAYTYDTLNNLVQVNQGVQVRTFGYDSLSRLRTATNPESGLIQYSYDNNSNLTSKTDARGVITNYVYDNINRVTSRNYSDGTPAVTYTYDNLPFAKGRLTQVASAISTTNYNSFDNLGRVLASQQITDGQTYNFGYSYNLSGMLVNETYPSGRIVTNQFETDGDLAQVTGSFQGANKTYAGSFNYTSAGAVSAMQLGNGRWENTTFNARLQPTQIGLGSSANAQDLWKVNYDYGTTDNNGNVKSQQITVPSQFTAIQNYSYDSLNRIKQATETISGSQTWKQTFVYDRYGNRRFDSANTTTLPSQPQNIVNPTIDTANNKFTTGQGYVYDLSGNVIQDAQNRTFYYNAEGKQKEVRDASNQIVGQYLYDGFGQRVKKISAQDTTIFVYDGNGDLAAEYLVTTNQSQAPTTSYLTNDTLGSPRVITDQAGNVQSRRDFRPFGEEIARANYGTDKIRQKFTTYDRDNETDLDYAQARMYANKLGRFLVADMPIIAQEKANPQTFNLFSYALNNPFSIVDPDGHRWFYQVDKENTTIDLRWVNPNEDGSYTSPDGEGWQSYIAPEGGGRVTIGSDGKNWLYFGEDENGSPITGTERMLATGATLPADDDLIGGALLIKSAGKALARIGSGALSKWLFKETVEGGFRLTANEIGKIGEKALANYLGNLGGKKFFKTTAGRRFVDYVVDRTAHEAKTGAAAATKFIRQQIAKDVRLLAEKQVDEVTWHFFRSPVTGKIGPSATLRKELTDAGIKILEHFD